MLYFMLKIGIMEVTYWLKPKAKIKITTTCIFLCTLGLTMVCIGHGLMYLNNLSYFWDLEFSKFVSLYIFSAFWISCLTSLGLLDLSWRLLPYCLTLPLALVGFVTLNFNIASDFFDTFFLLLLLSTIFISRRISSEVYEKIGFGDIMFLFALSFWLDTFSLSIAVFLAATSMVLTFLMLKGKFSWTQQTRLPLGPALSFFSILVGFFGLSLNHGGLV